MGPSKASRKVEATFTREQVAALEPDKLAAKWCGLVAGCPVALQVVQVEQDDTLGIDLEFSRPPLPDSSPECTPRGCRPWRWSLLR